MITVTVALHSAVHPRRSRELASIVIVNDGTGNSRQGNYQVAATRHRRRVYRASVQDFPRRSRSALELLRRGLNALAAQGALP